ncbi:MAG TPA: hypothetical protein PKD51_07130, partial [Saprospiraceae bacterium]|nr:hypothetical protein [Saprospiraceae bacterium]
MTFKNKPNKLILPTSNDLFLKHILKVSFYQHQFLYFIRNPKSTLFHQNKKKGPGGEPWTCKLINQS